VLAASAVAIAVAALAPTSALAADARTSASAHSHAENALTPSELLASTPWKTTAAFDQNGERIALDTPAVASFVGWAYFDADGTYTMYNLDDTPKLRGEWTVAPDGSERWINARNAAGDVLFQRVVPITELTRNVFTYRVFPNAGDTGTFYDIVHTRTNHVEPGTDAKGPGVSNGQGNALGHGGDHFNNGNAH
jgi:hypothetical protein